MIMDYIAFAFLMFFITYFIDIFIQFFTTKTIIPRKMFTYKKGGVFEHYIIVSIITASVVIIHLITGQNPFIGDDIISNIIFSVPFIIVAFIFLVFLFIFTFYFITYFYIKVTKVEDKKAFYEKHTNRMIYTAFGLALFIVGAVVITGLIGLF